MTAEQVWRCDRCGEVFKPITSGDGPAFTYRLVDSWRHCTFDLCEVCAPAFVLWVRPRA